MFQENTVINRRVLISLGLIRKTPLGKEYIDNTSGYCSQRMEISIKMSGTSHRLGAPAKARFIMELVTSHQGARNTTTTTETSVPLTSESEPSCT